MTVCKFQLKYFGRGHFKLWSGHGAIMDFEVSNIYDLLKRLWMFETSKLQCFVLPHTKGLRACPDKNSKFPCFQVLELIDSWFNLDFWFSGTRFLLTLTSKVTKVVFQVHKSKFHNLFDSLCSDHNFCEVLHMEKSFEHLLHTREMKSYSSYHKLLAWCLKATTEGCCQEHEGFCRMT